jgi:hypothetical protein
MFIVWRVDSVGGYRFGPLTPTLSPKLFATMRKVMETLGREQFGGEGAIARRRWTRKSPLSPGSLARLTFHFSVDDIANDLGERVGVGC